MEENEKKSILINPADIENKTRRKIEEPEKIEKTVDESYYNRQDRVNVELSTMNRFDAPVELFFRDYTNGEVNDILLSRHEKLLETMIAILNKSKNEDATCDMGDALPQEFLECLISISHQFKGKFHDHVWMCECQYGKDQEEVETNTDVIDLKTLNYTSIEEADEKLREYVKKAFDAMSNDDFQSYLKKKYGTDFDTTNITKETEVENLKVKEPFKVISTNGDVCVFRFVRMGDIVKAQKYMDLKYTGKIRRAQKQTFPNTPKEHVAEKRKEAVEKLKDERDRKTVLASQAFSLLEANGKKLSDDEKIKFYEDMPNMVEEFADYMNIIRFGLDHEIELVCPLCGKANRRSLQREFDFTEFLPINTNAKRKSGEPSKLNILF